MRAGKLTGSLSRWGTTPRCTEDSRAKTGSAVYGAGPGRNGQYLMQDQHSPAEDGVLEG